MKLMELLPRVFTRSQVEVEAEDLVFVAASLLRLHQIDALLLREGKRGRVATARGRGHRRAIPGYAILFALLQSDPEDCYRLLFRPCGGYTTYLNVVPAGGELTDLLDAFAQTRFGLACLESNGMQRLVTLDDVLSLYRDGAIGTDLSVRDVASPVFRLGRDTRLRSALEEMFKRRNRRVFLTGESGYITDRAVISYLFDPEQLEAGKDSPEGMLDCALGEVQTKEPVECEGGTGVEEASRLVRAGEGGCLVCDEGLITPWDLVMKPFASGHLNVR